MNICYSFAPRSRNLLVIAWLCLYSVVTSQETFTNAACRAVTTQMNSCAKRWDSIRTECTKSVTTNTIWPGPCECAYFANDLPCFDEREFCAAQVWTQVPQWFRDGVTSCLMKDATFTVRAQLGNEVGRMGNPFTVSGLAGNATRTAASAGTSPTARAGGSASTPTAVDRSDAETGLSVGAKAGFGIGIGVGVIMIAVMAFLLVHRKRRTSAPFQDAEAKNMSITELHEDTHIQQLSSRAVYPKNEMMASLAPQHELGTRASTYLAELPSQNSRRQSRP